MPPSGQADFRVLIVTHFFPGHGGGIERVAERLMLAYLESGWRVHWVASGTDETPSPSLCRAVPVRAWNGVERATGIPYPLWDWSGIRRLWKEVRAADAVHVHEHIYFGSVLAIAFSRLQGRRVVLTQHVGDFPFRSSVARGFYRTVSRVLAAASMSLSSAVVFVSDSTRAFFEGAKQGRAGWHTIYNGVDTNRFAPLTEETKGAVRHSWGIPAAMPVVLFVGRFVPKKGLPLLQQLARRLPMCAWVFAGKGPLSPRNWDLPNVRVLGQLAAEELAAAYAAADLLILPSRGEGFPLVVQEALACGLPVLITEETAAGCEAARSMVSTVATDNADDWVAAVEQALRLSSEAGHAARLERTARAAQLWAWEKSTGLHQALLEFGKIAS